MCSRKMISFLFLVSWVAGLFAVCFGETKITASDGQPGDRFGSAVDIRGNFAIVGARYALDGAGEAYIYQRNLLGVWEETQKITAPFPVTHFGWSVAISHNFAVIGCASSSGNTGSIFVYIRNGSTWTYLQALTVAIFPFPLGFSPALAVDGGRILLGDYLWDNVTGRVYYYRYDGATFVLDTIIEPSGLLMDDRFGGSVGLSGDEAIIGANTDSGTGAVYFYRFYSGGPSLLQKMAPPDLAAYDNFGLESAIDHTNGLAVVGAPYHDFGAEMKGAVYIYRYNGSSWVQDGKLEASDGKMGDVFGIAVDLDSGRIVAGASGHDDNGDNVGAAFLYSSKGVGWQEKELLASDGAKHDLFGEAAAIDDDTAIIGALGDDPWGDISGSAYLFGPRSRFDDFNVYLCPWPYIYIYTGCGYLTLGQNIRFELITETPFSRPPVLQLEMLRSPEMGRAYLDGNILTYQSDGRHSGLDQFYLSVRDEAGNKNLLEMQVLVLER